MLTCSYEIVKAPITFVGGKVKCPIMDTKFGTYKVSTDGNVVKVAEAKAKPEPIKTVAPKLYTGQYI